MTTATQSTVDLTGKVVAVAGASGASGRAALRRLAAAGAVVSAADNDAERLDAVLEATRAAVPGARVSGQAVDLLDPQAARDWADHIEAEHGHVDGLIHLVGGWRGGKSFDDTHLSDWDFLQDLLVRTVQHTSLAFHDPLLRSPAGRYAIVSAAGAAKPTAGNAAYAAAKAAAEAWTGALADSFAKAARAAAGPESGDPEPEPTAAAAILVVKALLTPEMRAAKPNAKFAGFTPVDELAEAFAGLWNRPAAELNGQHLWLTPR
ncbi:SDR family NAD(P)-dependent oxidoreductase [Phaeacidiphilus oryzae]|jgi:NAD(P)-dependent dehydrogenase (short-subunit alcohol dehydrogenase family)|uniref:SDR family NAD(P)-dependent oxidoreductase n=1 Tax=Phaeacidiphilus oryzae TaxID=348818 RepID=UPI000568DB72|nr:SDR family NAD(P)-dependent oxidoreductase [Phaeacidiphilus oryzae]